MSYPPVSSDDRRELGEAAEARGVTIDDLVAEQAADIARRERETRRSLGRLARYEPAEAALAAGPVIPHDPETIERGRRNIAAIRRQFIERRRHPEEDLTP